MKIIADLHLHSKYSRAVSPQMVLPQMAKWGAIKGIDLLGTGDFTHPLWFSDIKSELEESTEGIFTLKGQKGPFFILSTELSSIYSQKGKTHRIHNIILAPNIAAVETINKNLLARGVNLTSDGRPIMGLSSRDLAELVLNSDERCLVIPAHAWTPWFSLYGSESGFNSIDDCFLDLSDKIFAIETGLSSDPEMNWQIEELDRRSIVSFSDAHSLPKLGREATVFIDQKSNIKDQNQNLDMEISYNDIISAIKQDPRGKLKIGSTIEFYPEEGKYHYTGHRNCGVRYSPEETEKRGEICPVCGKRLTVGVMHRVKELNRKDEIKVQIRTSESGVKWFYHPQKNRPPYAMLVPLQEILAEVKGSDPASVLVQNDYQKLTAELGGEFNVLLKADLEQILKIAGEKTSEAIKKVRTGDIVVEPGYDGVFGKVKIWNEADLSGQGEDKAVKEQLELF